jgi:hypothetical protein
MNTSVKLTDNQKAMLCWLDELDGELPFRVGLTDSNSALAYELVHTLIALGYLKNSPPDIFPRVYKLTPEAKEVVNTYRYNKTNGCKSCVRLNCVCVVKLLCFKGEKHGGCHGSHE